MITFKQVWTQLKLRWSLAWRVFFNFEDRWFVIEIDEENTIKMLEEKPYYVNMHYHRLTKYNVDCIIKKIADEKDDIQRALDKATFEAECELNSKKH